MHNFQIDRGLCLNQSYQQIFCVPILFPHVMCGKVKFRCIKYFSIYFDREKTQNNIRNTKILNFYLFILYICRQTDKHKIYQNLIWLGQMEKYIFRLFFLVFFCHHLPYLWPMCECVKGMNGKMIGRNMQIDWTMFVTRHTNSCFVAVGIIHELMHDISVMCFEKDINIFLFFLLGCRWGMDLKRNKENKRQKPSTTNTGTSIQSAEFEFNICIWSVSTLPCYRHLNSHCTCVFCGVRSLFQLNNSIHPRLCVNSFPFMQFYSFALSTAVVFWAILCCRCAFFRSFYASLFWVLSYYPIWVRVSVFHSRFLAVACNHCCKYISYLNCTFLCVCTWNPIQGLVDPAICHI